MRGHAYKADLVWHEDDALFPNHAALAVTHVVDLVVDDPHHLRSRAGVCHVCESHVRMCVCVHVSVCQSRAGVSVSVCVRSEWRERVCAS